MSRLSGNFQAIRKLFGPSRKYPDFPDHSENIQTFRKFSRLSGNFPGYLKPFRTILTIRKFSRRSGNLPVQFQGLRAKTFWMRKKFPDGNATMPRWFLGLWDQASHGNALETPHSHILKREKNWLKMRYKKWNLGFIYNKKKI